MANSHRGDVQVTIDEATWTFRLNLTALADIEDALKVKSINDLMDAMSGPVSATKLRMLAHCMLRGGGHEISLADAGRIDWTMDQLNNAVMDCMAHSKLISVDKAGNGADPTPLETLPAGP